VISPGGMDRKKAQFTRYAPPDPWTRPSHAFLLLN
jgi:hypothetical protein